jgi:hypothetical protein
MFIISSSTKLLKPRENPLFHTHESPHAMLWHSEQNVEMGHADRLSPFQKVGTPMEPGIYMASTSPCEISKSRPMGFSLYFMLTLQEGPETTANFHWGMTYKEWQIFLWRSWICLISKMITTKTLECWVFFF